MKKKYQKNSISFRHYKSNYDEILNEEINYSEIKENYINKIKNNIDKELKKIIENAFLLFNRKKIIRNIVKKSYQPKL